MKYQSRPYVETRPRHPVTGPDCGPGPCYALPGLIGQNKHDPTSVHTKAPAFHFGQRHLEASPSGTLGPGPGAYFPQPKVYREGKEVTPACVIINRRPESRGTTTPGPAAYKPVSMEMLSGHDRPPAFSIPRATSPCHPQQRGTTPAPNAYEPDPMIGRPVRSGKRRAPGYTIRSRSAIGGFSEDRARTPGPGAYGLPKYDSYKKRSPAFTITGRNMMPGDNTKKPGPGAHSVERASSSLGRSSPAFSFGVRHSPFSLAGPKQNILNDDFFF